MATMNDIYSAFDQLIWYALDKKLITDDDVIYCRNHMLDILHLSDYETGDNSYQKQTLDNILQPIITYSIENGVCDDTITARDLLDTKLMGILTARPSTVIADFRQHYAVSPQTATDYFYNFCQDSNYIRRNRTELDMRWKTETEYGTLDITINLAKPEKDPRDIANAKDAPVSGYPKCLLCAENEGYAGHMNHPARQNHRIIPIEIYGQPWGFQYSPYVYYNEHCIVLNKEHKPMVIDRSVFEKLLSFVEQFPHYFIGSNADLPIVGGSILTHEHFQGGRYVFPMERAEIEHSISLSRFHDVKAGIVKWPMSVIRLSCGKKEDLINAADYILTKWRSYSDPSAGIYAYTDNTPHNTITPIARKRDDKYELDLVLRNNITTPEHPLGVFHPHNELHHIKKENIGLIEVMGLAVLPSRLRVEMALIRTAILENRHIEDDKAISKHTEWIKSWRGKYRNIKESTIDEIIQHEIGLRFGEVLSHAGVFKRDEHGMASFLRFIAMTI